MSNAKVTIKTDPFILDFKEPLINYLYGMKRKAHGAQKPRHIKRIGEVASTA